MSKKQNHDTNEEYIGKGKSAIGYAFRSRDFRRGKKNKIESSVRRFKANPNFLLREIAGGVVLIPVGDAGVFENSH